MYASTITPSMNRAISETNRRREIQENYNQEHHITPKSIVKSVRNVLEAVKEEEEEPRKKRGRKKVAESSLAYTPSNQIEKEEVSEMSESDREALILSLTKQMEEASSALEFERAAVLRDQIAALKRM